VNKSSQTNVILLLVVLAGAVAYLIDDPDKNDPVKNKKLQAALTAEPAPQLEVPKDPFAELEMATYRRIVAAYTTGDFDGALRLSNQALATPEASPAFKDWLTRQWPVLMTSVAWMKIKTQDCDEASKIFYKVLGVAQVPEAQKGLGFCLRVSKNWPEAASYLATYVLARPEDIEGRLIYADTLESLGRFDEAVTILEGAQTAGEGQEAAMSELAKQRLQAMKAKAKSGAKQKTERSEHFYVSYREDDHEAILRPVLDILEAAVQEYSEIFGVAPPATPVEVILYRKEEFRDVIPGGPGWAEGVFDGRMRIPVASHMLNQVQGPLATVLRHELSHALLSLRSNGRAWPTWFDEGTAQYLSCRQRDCDQFRFPPTPGVFSPVEALNQPFVTLDSVEAGRAYLHSLYMVRGIVRKKGELGFTDVASRVPATGPLTSEFIAEVSGWDSFALLWRDVNAWWGQKEIL
jgi:tetratricopeptide (TPR) repeat protein